MSFESITKEDNPTFLSVYDIDKENAGLSKKVGIHSTTIQEISKVYVKSRKQFKKLKLKWRSRKRRTLGWIPFKASAVKIENDSFIHLGQTYRFWKSREHLTERCQRHESVKLVTGSIVEDSRGRWYVNFTYKVQVEPDFISPMREGCIGIDLGLKTIATCSDGTRLERVNITEAHAKKLAIFQRANKKKQVRNIHAKSKNRRKDWNHKTTTTLIENNRLIRIGDISSSSLMKTSMAKSIADASWFQFKSMLLNKAGKHGVDYAEINEAYTTVTCSCCLEKTGPSGVQDLNVREWTCSNCGRDHDRDVNAATNILLKGMLGTLKKDSLDKNAFDDVIERFGQPDAGCLSQDSGNVCSVSE
jgi:IS605 OrfB family transposase